MPFKFRRMAKRQISNLWLKLRHKDEKTWQTWANLTACQQEMIKVELHEDRWGSRVTGDELLVFIDPNRRGFDLGRGWTAGIFASTALEPANRAHGHVLLA
jgi:hypothetical protein